MSSTRPRPPLARTHSTARMKKLELEGADSARVNDTIPGIRQTRPAPTRTRRARRHPAARPGGDAPAVRRTGVDRDDLLEVSISTVSVMRLDADGAKER